MKSIISKLMFFVVLSIFIVGCADTTSRVIDERPTETSQTVETEEVEEQEVMHELSDRERYILLSADMTCRSFAAGGTIRLNDDEADAIANEFGFESWDEFLELDDLYEDTSELSVIAKIRELCPQFFTS